MKTIFEAMIIIILFTILTVTNACQITANLEITAAREFHSNCIEQIQSSNFDSEVVENLKNLATNEDHPEWLLETKNVSVYDDRKDMKVTLKYKLTTFPFFEDREYRTIIGYAR